MPYAIRAKIGDETAQEFAFARQKTMYGGKHVAPGDVIFLFSVDNGLFARGIVADVERHPPLADPRRQTPRVSIEVKQIGKARAPLGSREVRGFIDAAGGTPEAEIDFKFYRQATPKIVGITDTTAAFLESLVVLGQAT